MQYGTFRIHNYTSVNINQHLINNYISQNKLVYAAVTNNPQIPVAYNKIHFPC